MQVRVRNPIALEHEADAIGIPLFTLSKPDQAPNSKNVHRQLFIEVAPPIDLETRNDEHVTWPAGLDSENGKDTVIRPHKATWRATVQNLGEN